jgi:hypothetical protein
VFPVAIGICEDDLKYDLTFLKAFAGRMVDLRVTPLRGGTLEAKAARLVGRQAETMRASGLPVSAVIVHHDVDRASFVHRAGEIERWFQRHGLAGAQLSLVVCAPDPCLERWLCLIEGLKASNAKPSAGGEPWKRAWTRGKGIPLDRVRAAAARARDVLRGQPDFDRFLADWQDAGLDPRAGTGE